MEPEPAPEPAPERNTSTRTRAASAGGKLVHVPSAPSALPLGAAKDGAAKIGTTKRRGTTEVIFEGSDMQAAVAALALVDSSDEEPPEASPEASPRAKGRPRSRSASFANEAVVDFRVTPSLQRTLDTLERIGLGRHKTMFLRERITFDTLGVLVEDDAKLAELGLAMGERLRLHKELRPAPAAQPELAPALRRPVRRNSFDRWYGEVEAEEIAALCGRLRLCVRVGCLNKNGPAKQPGTLFSTLFPQVTAMAATGNLSLIKAMAAHMGDEARAVNNYMQGNTVGKGGGLDYWGPTMNIGRDPVTCQCIAPRAVSLSRCPLPLRRLNANMDRCVRARSGGGGRKNRSRSARGSTEHTRRISFADSRARRTVSVPSRRRRAASTSMPVSHSLRPPQPTAADRAALQH